MIMKSQLFFSEIFVDVLYKSIKSKEFRCRHEIHNRRMLWIGQGKPTMAWRLRFVQQILNFIINFLVDLKGQSTQCDEQRTVQMFKPFVELKNG